MEELETLVFNPGHAWPPGVVEAAVEAFGPAVLNIHSRTYKTIDRRVRHALKVWRERYGLSTPATWEYAGDVLVSAIKRGSKQAAQPSQRYPFVQRAMETVVNHEDVHAGFERRLTRVDVRALLEDVA